jgi:hypothetical protein
MCGKFTTMYSWQKIAMRQRRPLTELMDTYTSSMTVKHLSSTTLESIPIPVPSMPVHDRPVARIDELFAKIDGPVEVAVCVDQVVGNLRVASSTGVGHGVAR